MYKTTILIILVIIFATYFTNAKEYTPVKQCGKDKLFKNVAIYSKNGLCKRMPCQFKLGEELKVEIEFKNKNRVEKIAALCKAKVLGSEIDFPVPDGENGCDHLVGAQCPVAANTDLQIEFTVPVMPPAQLQQKLGIDVTLQFSLDDQNQQQISCFQVSAKVQL